MYKQNDFPMVGQRDNAFVKKAQDTDAKVNLSKAFRRVISRYVRQS